MSIQSTVSTRGKLWASTLLVVLLFCLTFFVVWNSRTYPIDLTNHQALTVTNKGDIIQGGTTIARLADNGTIKLPLLTPKTVSDITALDLTLHFAEAAEGKVTPQLISIQGVSGAQFSWNSPTELHIVSSTYSPESYTTLEIASQSGFFQPGVSWYIRSGFSHLSFWTGVGVGLIFIFIAYLYMIRATRRPLWKSTQQLNTPPLGMTPIQLAILHHSTIEPVDFVAFLFYLAHLGYFQVIENSNGVALLRSGKTEGLAPFESGLLAIIFPDGNQAMYIEDLVGKLNADLFSAVVSQLYVEIYNTFNNRHFFSENPRIAHVRYKTIGILVQIAAMFFLVLAPFHWLEPYPALLPAAIGLFVAGWYIYRKARLVTPFTREAANYIAECAGFMEYLSSPRPIGSEGSQGSLFYDYAPYALSVRMNQQWLARFVNIPWYVPDWYVNSTEDIIDPTTFLEHVQRISSRVSELMVKVKDPNAD